MGVALHGNLRDFGIGEVFQLIGQQRKTGVLQVEGPGGRMELRFVNGRIASASPVHEHPDGALGEMLVRCGLLTPDQLAAVELERQRTLRSLPQLLEENRLLAPEAIAEVEALLTRETLFELLRWEQGSFRFSPAAVAEPRASGELLGAEQVLMDGLRMVDEWRAFGSELPDESLVLRRRGPFEAGRLAAAGSDPHALEQQERVFLLVDGRSTVRRVIDLSRLGTFEGMRALVALLRAGLVEPVTAQPGAREAAQRAAQRRARRERAWAWLSPFAGVALLAVLVVAGGWLRGCAPGAAAPRSAPALAEIRTRYELWRAQRLNEAFRFARGRWPRDAEELRRFERGAGRLAALLRSPYTSRRREAQPPAGNAKRMPVADTP